MIGFVSDIKPMKLNNIAMLVPLGIQRTGFENDIFVKPVREYSFGNSCHHNWVTINVDSLTERLSDHYFLVQ